ncbi:hypothetical protein TKK_0009252 [Trichogramma kaykai]
MSEDASLADKIKRLFFGMKAEEAVTTTTTTTTTTTLAQPKNSMTIIESAKESDNARHEDATYDNNVALQIDNAPVNSSVSFKVFSKEMEKFLNYTKEHEKLLRYYVHQRPHLTDKQLNYDIDELQSLMAEIKNSLTTVKKLKAQQKLIRKDIASVKKSVKKVKDNEIHELETIVSCYDKDMFGRWLKSKWKPDELEGLMFDVQEKKLALDSLEKLINLQLSKNEDSTSDDWESVADLAEASDDRAPTTATGPAPADSTLIIKIEPKTVARSQAGSATRPSTHNRISTRFAWEQRRFR